LVLRALSALGVLSVLGALRLLLWLWLWLWLSCLHYSLCAFGRIAVRPFLCAFRAFLTRLITCVNAMNARVRALWSAIHQQHKRGLSLFRAPLTAASFLGLRGVITQLLENGVALESRDGDYNQTPLSHAVQRGHVVVTK